MKILFICTANKDRSRTAEIHFQNKYPQYIFRSAGINKYLSEKHGGIYVQEYMLEATDRIICMEDIHAKWLDVTYEGKYSNKIETLYLGDTETFMSESLIELLENKLTI